MTPAVQSAKTRFTNWCALGGVSLIAMGRLVEEQLLPSYLAAGFERVAVHMRNPKDIVGGRQICLERCRNDEIDAVIFNFDKYRRPTFQVHLHRRKMASPYPWVRAANLVRRPSQYLHFWGKPWWCPTRLWTQHMSASTVECLGTMTDKALAFLERGERCSNISKAMDM